MASNDTSSWTPVALSADLPPGTVVPAWTPNGNIALWRGLSGALAASAERCPHRGMRLSHGFVRGETLSCIYHGWSFSQDGHCTRIPAHSSLVPPTTINTNNQAVSESDGIVWVAADDTGTPLPSFSGAEPLRTMVMSTGLSALEAATGAKIDEENILECSLNGVALKILAVEQGHDHTLLIIMISPTATLADRVAASRAAEVIRRQAEELQEMEIAP